MVNNLEEMIKHCEEVAEKKEKECKWISGSEDAGINGALAKTFAECASEHKQLAKWLKELKKLREIPDKLVPKYRDGIQDEYNRGANEMLEEVIDDIRKYIAEVNADET